MKKIFKCRICGEDFWGEYPDDAELQAIVDKMLCNCDLCAEKAIQEEIERQKEYDRIERDAELRRTLQSRLDAINLPENLRNLVSCPVVEVGRQLWPLRTKNILLTGATGEGKSTSAAYVAKTMVEREAKQVKYFNAREIMASWKAARMGQPYEEERFLKQLGKLDLLIIDEAADRFAVTDSAAEFYFNLIDSVYNGRFRCKMWLLGNFKTSSLKKIFTDTDPVYRRLNASFARLRLTGGKLEKFELQVENGRNE